MRPVLRAALLLVVLGAAAAPAAGATLVVTAGEDPDSLDPALAYDPGSWQILVNAGEGLVAFDRAGGAAGARVVPALARAMPVVSRGGRRLTFALRRSARFGPPADRPVRASDVTASLARLQRMRSPGRALFRSIAGMAADDASGRVTLTLRRPDPSLLSALALPFGDVLPRGTPASDQSEARIASAGPYRVASYAPGSAITLVRNPGYAPGAAGPAEPGPETIRVRLGVGASAGLSAVIDGSADYVQDRPSAGDLRRARAARSAVRVRRHVEGATYYFFMNTRRAPFDDVRVRTAVSAAIDRAALARAFGGEAVPTAQVLPPFVPGRRRIDPAPTPDPARARELVRRAGAAGAAVSVWGWSSEPSATVTRMLARTLAGIGLRPRTRLWDRAAMLAALADPAAPSQIGFARWQQDYPEGGDWFPLLLSREAIRPAGTLNYALLDDPALDDLIDRTAAAWDPAARAAGWADVGRAVARRAPWAPFANPVRADVVSRRVRGYVASPLYGFLWMRARVARS